MGYSKFLQSVLKLDCASCLAMAALLIPGATILAATFGISEELLQLAGFALIPLGLFIGWLGVRGEGPAGLVVLVVLGNIGWTVASFALAASLASITSVGVGFVVLQALAVMALAVLEWRGLRQSSAALA